MPEGPAHSKHTGVLDEDVLDCRGRQFLSHGGKVLPHSAMMKRIASAIAATTPIS